MADERNFNITFTGDASQLEKIIKNVFGEFNAILKGVASTLKAVADSSDNFSRSSEKVSESVSESARSINYLERELEKAEKKDKELVNTLKTLATQFKTTDQSVETLAKEMYAVDSIIKQFRDNMKLQADSLRESGRFTKDHNALMRTFASIMDTATITAKVHTGQMKATKAELAEYFNKMSGGLPNLNDFSDKLIKNQLAANRLAVEYGRLAVKAGVTSQELKALYQDVKSGDVAYGDAIKMLNVFINAHKSQQLAIEKTEQKIQSLTNKNKELINSNKEFAEKFETVVAEIRHGLATFDDLNNLIENQKNQQKALKREYKEQEDALKPLINRYEKFAETNVELRTVYAEMLNKFRQGKADIVQVKEALSKFDVKLGLVKSSTEGARLAAQKLNDVYGPMVNRVKGLSQVLDKQANDVQFLGKRYDTANAQIKEFIRLQNQQEASLRKTEKGFMGIFTTLTRYWSVYEVLQLIVRGVKATAEAIAEYDQSLRSLKAITQATEAQTQLMGERLKQVTTETQFSMQEVSKGMQLLAQAGLTADETIKAIGGSAQLAQGTLEDMEKTTDLVSSTMVAFKLSAADVTRIVDVMANAINKSKLDIQKLRVAFNYVSTTAHTAGISLEETAAAMMVLADAGIRASTIGTGLRRVFQAMIAPSARVRELMIQHGIALDGLNPKTQGFVKALGNLSKAFTDVKTGAIDTVKLLDIFQLQGSNTAAALITAFKSGKFEKVLENAYALGTAADMSGEQMEGLSAKAKNFTEVSKILAVQIGERGLTNIFKELLDVLKESVVWITKYYESLGRSEIMKTVSILLDKLGEKIKEANKEQDNTIKKKEEIKGFWNNFAYGIELGIQGLGKFIGIIDKAGTSSFGKLNNSLLGFNTQLIDNAQILAKSASAANESIAGLSALHKRLSDLAETEKKGKDVKVEYLNEILRLKQEYPELTSQISSNINKLSEMPGVLRKIIDTQFAKSIEATKGQLESYSKAISDAVGGTGVYKVSMTEAGASFKDLDAATIKAIGSNKDLLRVYTESKKEVDSFVSRLTVLAETEAMSSEEVKASAEAFSKQNNILPSLVAKLVEELIPALDDIAQRHKVARETAAIATKQMDADWQKFYDGLRVSEQADFIAFKVSADKKIAAYKQNLDNMNDTTIDKDKMLLEYREKLFSEYLEKRKKKEIKTIIETAKATENINRQSHDEAIVLLKERQAKEDNIHKENKRKRTQQYVDALKEIKDTDEKSIAERKKLQEEYVADIVDMDLGYEEKNREIQNNILSETDKAIEQRKKLYEEETAQRKRSLDFQLYLIEDQEAKGVLSSESANLKKSALNQQFYSQELTAARAHYDEIKRLYPDNVAAHKEMTDKVAAAEAAYYSSSVASSKAKTDYVKKEKEVAAEKEKDAKEQAMTEKQREEARKSMLKASAAGVSAYFQALTSLNNSMEQLSKNALVAQGTLSSVFAVAVGNRVAQIQSAFSDLVSIAGKYGITLDSMNKLSMPKAIELITQKYEKMRELREAMKESVKASEDFMQSVSDWKTGLSEVDVAKNKFAEAYASLVKVVGKLKDVSTITGEEVTKAMESSEFATFKFSEVLKRTVDGFVARMEEIKKGSVDVSGDIQKSYQEFVEAATTYIEALKGEWESLGDTYVNLSERLKEVEKDYAEFVETFKSFDEAFSFASIKKGTDHFRTMMDESIQKFSSLRKEMEDTQLIIDSTSRALEEIASTATKSFSEISISMEGNIQENLENVIKSVDGAYDEIIGKVKESVEEMKSQWDSLSGKIQDVNDKIINVQEDYEETVRNLMKETMSEHSQWQSDRIKAETEYKKAVAEAAKGRYDVAEEYFKKAQSLAQGLAVEIKNEEGTVIATLENTTQASVTMLKKINDAYIQMLGSQKQGYVEQKNTSEEILKKLLGFADTVQSTYEDKILSVQDAIKQKQKEITGEIDATTNALKKMNDMFAKQLEFNTQFYTPGGLGMLSGFAGGGLVNVPGASKTKDSILALLSNKEFVMNPKAVETYGSGLLSAINQQLIPPEALTKAAMGLSKASSMMSGMALPAIQKFAEGGMVGGSTSNTQNTYNYHGAFTINGSDKSAKEIAIEVDKIMTDRARYNRSPFYNMVKNG